MSYGTDDVAHSKLDVLAIVVGHDVRACAHALVCAHPVGAVSLDDPSFTYSPFEMLLAQTAMALIVAASATVAVLALSEDFDRLGARLTAALFLGALVGVESRTSGSSWRRSLGLALVALVIGVSIATVNWFIGH